MKYKYVLRNSLYLDEDYKIILMRCQKMVGV